MENQKCIHKKSIAGGVLAFILATVCCWIPGLAIVLGSGTELASFNEGLSQYSLYFMIAGFGFMAYGVYHYFKNIQKTKSAVIKSTITCAHCHVKKEENMPTNA